ncbi:MAG: hypothetical protein ACYC6Y_08130 [Thermoguttaceae bacterium]
MNLRATLGGLFAIMLWSTSVALARSLSRQLGPLNAAAVVYTFGGVVGLGWSLARQPAAMRVMLRLPPRYLLGCGGLFVFYTAAFFLALGLACTPTWPAAGPAPVRPAPCRCSCSCRACC